jgi:hypothetical protein
MRQPAYDPMRLAGGESTVTTVTSVAKRALASRKVPGSARPCITNGLAPLGPDLTPLLH